VIEVYPGAAQDLWGLPRKQDGVAKLQRALARRGVRGLRRRQPLSDHELDAVTAALVGVYYLQGRYRAIGDPREVQMILPA
jgi:predicted nuclease with RNAse H fold